MGRVHTELTWPCRLLVSVLVVFLISVSSPGSATWAYDYSGWVEWEWQGYPEKELDTDQEDVFTTVGTQLEFFHQWDNRNQALAFRPFLRISKEDSTRSHYDIREMKYRYSTRNYEFNIGMDQIFWGTVETQHLIDVINQKDLVEDLREEEKLGQPMIQVKRYLGSWGRVELFALPFFRDRTFPGEKGRLRTIPRVAEDRERYASGNDQLHTDWAARWQSRWQRWDIGLSYFYGLNREPQFQLNTSDPTDPVLVPFYDKMHQGSLDVQGATGNWLWKLEYLYRDEETNDGYHAWTTGTEYTFRRIFGTKQDLGVLSEWMYDEREDNATNTYNHDLMAGVRWALNDVQSSEVLAFYVHDYTNGANIINLEANRRLGKRWKLNLEGRIFNHLESNDPISSLRDDAYVQLDIRRFF